MSNSVGVLCIRVNYNNESLISDIQDILTYDLFKVEIAKICRITNIANMTIKWIDDEGDPCTISSQIELQEAIRLYNKYKERMLNIHVFPNTPEPGLPCDGETQQLYRKNAKRFRKTYYHALGHKFEPKRLNRNAICHYCQDRIWGLSRQGYRCVLCKLMLHRMCRMYVSHTCGDERPPTYVAAANGDDGVGLMNQAYLLSLRKENDSSLIRTTSNALNGVEEPVHATHSPDKPSLDDFRLLKVIGRGSYAKVLQVEHKLTRKIYALKAIKKTLITDEEDIEWVQTEKHVFEIATNHPFLVGLHSCFQNDTRLFFVIEFISGGDLMYHMQRKLRLPENHACFYSAEICLALNFLHEKCIIYRDLKLDNVLMDNEGHIKLTDYGMCKEGIVDRIFTKTFCGTPNYIAPEILKGYEYNFSVDWWALGVMMYEMVAGRSPWDGVGNSDNPDQNTEEYLFQVILHKPVRIPRTITPRTREILTHFLQKNPTDRLGCAPRSNFWEIKSHVFFRDMDWERLLLRQIQPPYKPEVQNDLDLSNFDPTFTKEHVQLTMEDPLAIARIDQTEFEDFEYLNPLLMTQEETV